MAVGAEEWERNFLELQEEFLALQERAASVDEYHQAELLNLQSQLERVSRHCGQLEQERDALLTRLSERDDEIRYLQVELETVMADRQKEASDTCAARQTMRDNIAYIKDALQVGRRLDASATEPLY